MILTYLIEIAKCPDKFSFSKKEFLKVAVYELAITEEEADYLHSRLIGRNRLYVTAWNDNQRRDFLDKLDNCQKIQPSRWEAEFLEGTMHETEFTDPQREAIDRMIAKYRDTVRW